MDGLKRLIPGTQEHREHEEKESHSSYERHVHDSYTGGANAGGMPTVSGGGAGGLAGNLDNSSTTRPHTGGLTNALPGGHRDSAALHHQGVETPIGAGAGALAGAGTAAEQGHGVRALLPGTQEHHMNDQARHAAHGTTGGTMSKIKSHIPGTTEHHAAKTTGI